MTYRTLLPSTLCGTLLLAMSQAFATVIVSDTFTGATLDAGVVESVLDYGPATATSTHTVEVGTLDGNALRVGGGAGSIYLTAGLGQSVSLGEVGDFIQANFDFTISGGNTGNRVARFGFFQSGATDDASVGYFIAGSPQSASGNNTILSVDSSTTANPFYTAGLSGGTSTVVGSGTLAAQFRVERTSATQVTLTGSWAGTTISPVVHTVGASSAVGIDELWFGVQNRSSTFVIDNLSVTAIPEPGTLALMGIALGSLLLFRRRK